MKTPGIARVMVNPGRLAPLAVVAAPMGAKINAPP
jgi:hypothetical protein